MIILKSYHNLSVEVKAGLWFTICNLTQRGIGFLTMPFFTRIMSKTGYGMFSTYLSWYSFLIIFSSLNLSNYVFNKGMVKFEDDRDCFQASLQALSSISTLIVFAVYLYFNEYINLYTGIDTLLMLCMFVNLFFEPSILLWTSRMRFEYKYIEIIIVTIGIAVISPILGILAVKYGNNEVFDRVLAHTIIPFVVGIVIYVHTFLKSKRIIVSKYWKYALSFNLPLIPHFLSVIILAHADRLMITYMCGADATALYSVAYALGMGTILLSSAIQQSFLPWLYTKMKKGDYSGIKEVTNATLLIVLGVCLLLILVSPEIMGILAPHTYFEAIWVIPPVCASVFFIYLFNLFANIEYYFEETKYVAVASIFSAMANCLLNYIFIRQYGFVAAGYTTLFCYIALAFFHFLVMKKVCTKYKFNEKIFNYKFIMVLSSVFLITTFLINALYKIAIVRYSLFSLIVLIIFLIRDKIIKTAFRIKGNS